MSRFLSAKYKNLIPYVPGEQPKEREYVKLNTNESPFPPSSLAVKNALKESKKTNLYSDPECKDLIEVVANYYGVKPDQVIAVNGSDEVLNFAFMAFCDNEKPSVFADITYGFYKVFADLNGVKSEIIPLNEDFSINLEAFSKANGTIFIANPNAPTGIFIPIDKIEQLVKSNPDRVVVVDEAYVDFGGESAVKLIDKYDNLLVTQTFSKSRSLAGARLGFGFANSKLIADLKSIKYSTNPYNVNKMTAGAGIGAIKDNKYFVKNCFSIIENREYLTEELRKLGFTLTDSKANFVFAKTDKMGGKELYLKLKESGVLVRHFDKPKINDYLRITIGTIKQMKLLVNKIKNILEKEDENCGN